MKVCIYTILGDQEEKHVDRWLKTTQPADVRVVVNCAKKNTASKLLKLAGVHVHQYRGDMFRFDHARNQALAAVPDECGALFCNDMDEVISDGFYDVIQEAMAGDGPRRLSYTYVHAFNPDGSPSKVFLRDAIHRKKGYAFKYPCHEVLVADHVTDLVFVPNIEQRHLQDLHKPRTSYLPLLSLSVDENPQDSHARFTLMRELFRMKNFERFRTEFHFYQALPNKIEHEFMTALRYRAEVEMIEHGATTPGRRQFLEEAVRVCPALREPHIDMADALIDLEDYKGAVAALETALAIQVRAPLSTVQDRCWGQYPVDLLAFAKSKL